ncbi:hypothetical protein AB7849_15500 [Rhodanobacter sp. 115]|uniref:hypothetical protein n=1 Tax=Rhodanobacter sp. FW021-MT20 TaxID=1162282 RepID=UPI0034E4C634
MTAYIVLYRPASAKPLDAPAGFPCQAHSGDQAELKCGEAHPGCEVLWLWVGTSLVDALDDYYGDYCGGQPVYLANACGERTGQGTQEVAEDDLAKVPFEHGPGVVLPYLTEIDSVKYLQGNLEVAYKHQHWGEHNSNLGTEREVRAYCDSVREFIRQRLPAGAIVLPLDDGYEGRITVQAAIPLALIEDADDARKKLGAIFGTAAELADVAGLTDLPS